MRFDCAENCGLLFLFLLSTVNQHDQMPYSIIVQEILTPELLTELDKKLFVTKQHFYDFYGCVKVLMLDTWIPEIIIVDTSPPHLTT